MGKRSFLGLLFIGIAIFALVSGGANAQMKGNPIVIKALTHLPTNHINNDPVPFFVEKVNKLAQGRLKINWVGGPEVIQSFDQIRALKTGAIDMLLYYPFAFMKSIMPEAEAKGLSELAEWEERKTGAYELWCEIIEKRANAKYLGRFHSLIPFTLYCNKKIEKVDDLKGERIRVMPLYVPLMKAMGAVPVTIPPPDIYTSMERGVVNGFMWPRVGMVSWGLHEVTKYVIDPGVFQIEPGTMINLDFWKKIPGDLQELLLDVMKDFEYIATMRAVMIRETEDKIRRKAGMKFIQLPPQEAAKFTKIASDATWGEVLKRATEYGPKLRKLTSKSAVPKGAFPW